jgi:uncharacterized protein (DUF427 family)
MRTARATWNGVTLAESDRVVMLEGNAYFPPDAVNHEHLVESTTSTVCPWKGVARYYTVMAGGEVNPDAAWHYPTPARWPARSRATWRSGAACGWRPSSPITARPRPGPRC